MNSGDTAWVLISAALDVLGVHGVGGIVGMVLLGLFATKTINPAGANGLFESGGFHFFGVELLATVVAVAFCFGMSYGIAKVIDSTMGLRVSPEIEFDGLDLPVHAETAYS
jgi:ammonium transporter, Amt family